MLERQKPYPAFALDRHWNVVATNAAVPELYDGVAPELMQPPVNAMRLSLHPRGLAPRIAISASGARIFCFACAGRSSSRRTPC